MCVVVEDLHVGQVILKGQDLPFAWKERKGRER